MSVLLYSIGKFDNWHRCLFDKGSTSCAWAMMNTMKLNAQV